MLQRYKYETMINAFRWIRVFFSFLFFCVLVFSALNYKTSIYLLLQGRGQLHILLNRETLSEYENKHALTTQDKENLELIEQIKKYSIDSLGYLPTNNFTTIYDQNDQPVLWVITASEPYALKAFEWNFPVVGRVSYKGFFKKELAVAEYYHLVAQGYDADLRSVSAWSTLGWFNDPLLSSMLKYNKGNLCNLLFHELFHATYYAPNSVNFNENIASFIAHKATIDFLKNDTATLKKYMNNFSDNAIYTRYMIRKATTLRNFYESIKEDKNRHILKLKMLYEIADSIEKLPLNNKQKFIDKKAQIFKFKNAYFVDFEQYDSMQDSLDVIFNKIYKANLKKLVQDLKQDKTIIKFDN